MLPASWLVIHDLLEVDEKGVNGKIVWPISVIQSIIKPRAVFHMRHLRDAVDFCAVVDSYFPSCDVPDADRTQQVARVELFQRGLVHCFLRQLPEHREDVVVDAGLLVMRLVSHEMSRRHDSLRVQGVVHSSIAEVVCEADVRVVVVQQACQHRFVLVEHGAYNRRHLGGFDLAVDTRVAVLDQEFSDGSVLVTEHDAAQRRIVGTFMSK
jgi:hypothetical protein